MEKKVMSDYIIYCTENQTRKAIELGAPIKHSSVRYEGYDIIGYSKDYVSQMYGIIPTTEEMIGWLREKDLFINVIHISAGYTSWIKTIKENITLSEKNTGYVNSFEEATLNGIDEALEYLIQNKK